MRSDLTGQRGAGRDEVSGCHSGFGCHSRIGGQRIEESSLIMPPTCNDTHLFYGSFRLHEGSTANRNKAEFMGTSPPGLKGTVQG